MNSSLKQLLLRWLILALGVMLATKLVRGIECPDALTLLTVVVLLSLFNAIVKPLLVLFTLPFIIVTMGLGLVVINALLFLLVDKLVDSFYVANFWSAVGGSLVVSITNWFASAFIRSAKKDQRGSPPSPPKGKGGGDVIDI